MAVRTERFVHLPAIPASTNGWLSLYTCPPDHTALVKDWHFVNRSGAARTMALAVRSAGADARIQAGGLVAQSGSLASSSRHVVLVPGDELVLFVGGESTSTAVDGVVCGALLEGVATP